MHVAPTALYCNLPWAIATSRDRFTYVRPPAQYFNHVSQMHRIQRKGRLETPALIRPGHPSCPDLDNLSIYLRTSLSKLQHGKESGEFLRSLSSFPPYSQGHRLSFAMVIVTLSEQTCLSASILTRICLQFFPGIRSCSRSPLGSRRRCRIHAIKCVSDA